FNGGPQGAKASAAIYSIVETAKANELDPYKYLNLLFNSLPGLDFISDSSLLDDYLPWCSDIKTICK
ncbi:MAG: transposase domain-containing protein, partial [Holdemanella porci]|uniref:transposase domain-containing protein n=1 Tax=Holdemanella porci TaxID=2652276 RepID=UPI002430ABE4